MNAMWSSILGGALVAVISGTFLWLGRRADAKANAEIAEKNRKAQERIDERKVDREEFDSLTRELRASLNDVKDDLEEERRLRATSDERAAAAEDRAVRAERRTAEVEKAGRAATRRLATRVSQLEGAMREAGVKIPPPAGDTD